MIQPSAIHLVAALIGALAVVTLALAIFLPHAVAARSNYGNQAGEKTLSSLAARIPISEIRDDLIVRRDGSFCAAWECSGIATQFADAERLEAVSSALDAFIKGIRHPQIELQFRYLIDYETPQVLEERKAQANCINSPAAWLEENRVSFWRSSIDAGQLRSIRLLAFLSWRPTRTWETRSATSRFAAAFWQGLTKDGFGKLPSIVRAAMNDARVKALVQRNREEHSRLVAEFNQVLETYRIGLEAITSVRRLAESELVRLLYRSLNPADHQFPNGNSECSPFLNTDWSEGIRYLDLGGVLKAVVTLSELPEATFASLLRPLMAVDFSSEVIVNVCVPNQAAKVRKLRRLLKKSLAFQLRKDGSRRRDFQAAALEKDTVDTLTSAITSSQRLVQIELAIVVSASTVARTSAEREKSEQELAQRVESVLQAFGQMNGARGYREDTALLPTFISVLPGVHGVRKTNREFTLLSGQSADFVPIEIPWTGTHEDTPAFLTRTREGTLLRFNPFSSELTNANVLLTGKTGSGKSFLIKQLLLQLQVLNPRIAIVTKGADYRALVELLGGQYREVSLRTNLVKNPWDLRGNPDAPDSAQIAGVASLAFHMAGKTGSDDAVTLNFLEKAVRMTYERLLAIGKAPRFSDLKWTLEHYPFENAVIEELAHLLALKLNRWTGEGVYGQLFDRETSPELDKTEDIICYDIDGLKDSPELQTAVAFTIARAIDQQIGRKDPGGNLRPTIAVFDEVWAMLADPVLGTQILNAFRTARKRYGSIIAASQGIEDFVGTAESPHTVGLAILQNTEAKFICAQLGELSRLRNVLHLSEPAVEAVKELRNVAGHFAESYLLVANQPESSTVIQLTATPFDYWATTSHPLENDFREKFAKQHPELSALETIYRLGLAHPKGLASSPAANRKGNLCNCFLERGRLPARSRQL
jgi:type IV secretory system conjugative DNA transfer VirD4/TraG family protein